MENDAFISDMTTPILLPSLTPETFPPLMLELYGHAIYQQELPVPQGKNDVFAPKIFLPITNPIVQQELPPLERLNQLLMPQLLFQIVTDSLTANITQFFSPDDSCDSTGATVPSRARSHICAGKAFAPDLSELPKGLPLFTPENGFSEFLNPAQAIVPEVAPQPQRQGRSRKTSKLDQVAIKTARRVGLDGKEIARRFGYTESQVYYALKSSVNPRKYLCGGKPDIPLDTANQIVEWIRRCKRNRFALLGLIPTLAPELNLHGFGMKSIRTAVKSLGHRRRKAKRKGYSNRPENRRLRREFTNDGILMSRESVYSMMSSDEVWVNGGLNAPSYATVLVSGYSHAVQMDRYHADCTAQKQDRLPGWTFHGAIYDGRKALGTFWEKN
ncbi:hypothetical protein K3495_g1346 [Podosphaera aphanis]|nr:hypothetical protein K3495_g1346 [Podosphaera aphanis]